MCSDPNSRASELGSPNASLRVHSHLSTCCKKCRIYAAALQLELASWAGQALCDCCCKGLGCLGFSVLQFGLALMVRGIWGKIWGFRCMLSIAVAEQLGELSAQRLGFGSIS